MAKFNLFVKVKRIPLDFQDGISDAMHSAHVVLGKWTQPVLSRVRLSRNLPAAFTSLIVTAMRRHVEDTALSLEVVVSGTYSVVRNSIADYRTVQRPVSTI